MMSKQETARRIIQALEGFQKYPQMYTGTDKPEDILNLITGMIVAFQICAHEDLLPRRDVIRDSLVQERGWASWSESIDQMRNEGLDNHTIIRELIQLEVAAVQQRAQLE